MKKILGLIVLVLSFASAQERIPVTALNIEPAVELPSDAYRILGMECDQERNRYAERLASFTINAHGCFFIERESDRQASALQLLSADMKFAGYELTLEGVQGETAILTQIWQKQGKNITLAYGFEPDGINLIALDTDMAQ